jgi:hypothetical protein
MATKPFPFITDGQIGDVPINFYPAADTERQSILQPSPGLLSLCALTNCSEVRELHVWDQYIYAVARRGTTSVVFKVSPTGTFVEIGNFATSFSGPVWMVHNLTQLCICDGVWAYVFTPSSGSFLSITDAAFPGASSVAYQDGYGLFTVPNSNEWFFSSLYDFLTFDAGDFYSKEGKPDKIISMVSDHREPIIFGKESTETWNNSGGDNTSPNNPTFARNAGGILEFGCASPKSPAPFDNTVAWLSDKGQLLKLQGYNALVMSSDMFGRAVAGFSTFSDAISFSYTDKEHNFYQITFPTGDQTWVLDAKTQTFHKKQSWKGNSEFGRHRANCYTLLNNKHYVGDFSNGKIYEMSTDYLDDDGYEIRREVHSMEIYSGLMRTYFPSVQIEFEPGVGLANGLDPQAMLQYSDDGGKTWSNELWRSVGKIGEYSRRAIWNRMGSAFRRVFKLTVTDPVVWRIMSISWWDKK